MHDRCEKFIRGELSEEQLNDQPVYRFGGKPGATIADKYIPVLAQFRDHPNGDRHTELRLGFDSEWYLCGGVSKTAWCVGVLDAARVSSKAYIGEWKSGKPKETHSDQRKLYALFALRRWLIDEVEVTTYYLEDTAPPDKLVVKTTAEDKLKSLWNGRVETMQNDKILAPRPGQGCYWCDYAKGKGGPCQFG